MLFEEEQRFSNKIKIFKVQSFLYIAS